MSNNDLRCNNCGAQHHPVECPKNQEEKYKRKEYQIDCEKFCGYVKVDDNNIIIKAMPIIHVFEGQPVQNLTDWASKKFGYCTLKELK